MKFYSKKLALGFLCGGILAAQQIPQADVAYRGWIQKDFQKFNTRYQELREIRQRRLRPLEQQVFQAERGGTNISCAHQILLETRWLIDATADFARIDRRLADLEKALTHPKDSKWADVIPNGFFNSMRSITIP